jgi:hypothetical protein
MAQGQGPEFKPQCHTIKEGASGSAPQDYFRKVEGERARPSSFSEDRTALTPSPGKDIVRKENRPGNTSTTRQALVAHACNPSYSGGRDFKASPGQIVPETLSQKYPTQNRAGGVSDSCSRALA